MNSESNSAITRKQHDNLLLSLPLEILLVTMDHLDSIYTLKTLLDAFPNELLPLFRTYSKSILNTIFWRPVRHYSDENGVVYRWMIRELNLGYLFDSNTKGEGEEGVANGGAVGFGKGGAAQSAQTDYRKDMWEGFRRKQRDRFILSDDNDID
jgi:hypothetical protein